MKIGYLLAKGFSNADVMASQAVLAISGCKIEYVGNEVGMLAGNTYPMRVTVSFDECRDLDIMIVPSLDDKSKDYPMLINYIRRMEGNCKWVLGLSKGVVALGEAGVLKNVYATSHSMFLDELRNYGAIGVNSETFVKDKKYITAGPSTATIEAAYYLVSQLRGKGLTKILELNLEYNPVEKYRHIPDRSFDHVDSKPLRIGVTCSPNLYLPDIAGAMEVFSKLPNAEIYFVWKKKGEIKAILGPTIKADTTFDECPPMDVIITGAIAPKDTVDPDLLAFYQKQSKTAKAVVGVCAGVFVLGAAGLLQDRRAVTNLHMMRMLKSVGASRFNTETTQDGKVYTAGPAIGSYEIALDVIAGIYGVEAAAYIEQDLLEYHPHPLYDKGTREKAGKIRSYLSLVLSAPLVWIYHPKVKKAYRRHKV